MEGQNILIFDIIHSAPKLSVYDWEVDNKHKNHIQIKKQDLESIVSDSEVKLILSSFQLLKFKKKKILVKDSH